MLNPIYTEETECQDCYKCLRHCPVKTIKVQDGHARIMTENCILCGNCVQVCPVGAKKVRNDLSRARRLLERHERVILSLAPSFVSEFPGVSAPQLTAALKKLGFFGVSETALGAREVTRHTCRQMETQESGIIISSACPTVVEYIKQYAPEYGKNIMDALSPLLTHCSLLRQYYGEDVRIVFAGPCISKKREADLRPDLLSVAISFNDLRLWLEEEDLDPRTMTPEEEDRFIPETSSDGSYYPLEGGMITSIKHQNPEIPEGRMLSFSNIHTMGKILKGLDSLEGGAPVFLELLACEGGCINGPAAGRHTGSAVKSCLVNRYAESLALPKEDEKLKCGSIHYIRDIDPPESPHFREEEIRRALRKIGKYQPSDEKNCGACGYMTCRDYAVAYLGGRAEKDMCVSYLKTLSEKKTNALIRTMPSGVVLVDNEMKIVQCNSAFAKLISPEVEEAYSARPGLKGASLEKILPFAPVFQGVLASEGTLTNQTFQVGQKVLNGSVFSIEKNQAVGGIFQDVTLPWVQKDRIIRQARQVMEKNISAVQQIAYLLGENAADSEVMLNTIIESFSTPEDSGDE